MSAKPRGGGVLEEIAERILALGARRVAVTGVDGAGKTRFAGALAGRLQALGQGVLLAHGDDFHQPSALRYARGRGSAEGFYRDTTDLAALRAALLDPLAPGGSRRVRRAVFDHQSDSPLPEVWESVPEGMVLILEGLFLIRRELQGAFDLTIFLDVPFGETFRRLAERDGSDPDPFAPGNARYRGGQEIWFAEEEPRGRADIVVDNGDWRAPRIL